MTKNKTDLNDTLPNLAELKKLSEEQVARIIAADYLRKLADLVQRNHVAGFDLAWDNRFQKPQGKLVMSSNQVQGPLELKLLAQIKAEDAVIPVEDASEILQEKIEEDPKVKEFFDDDKNFS